MARSYPRGIVSQGPRMKPIEKVFECFKVYPGGVIMRKYQYAIRKDGAVTMRSGSDKRYRQSEDRTYWSWGRWTHQGEGGSFKMTGQVLQFSDEWLEKTRTFMRRLGFSDLEEVPVEYGRVR